MKFKDFNTQELQRRFAGTYLYSLKYGDVFYIDNIAGNGEALFTNRIASDSPSDGKNRVEMFRLEEWVLKYPDLGFIPWSDDSLYLSRVPNKQYSYGYKNNNVRGIVPKNSLYEEGIKAKPNPVTIMKGAKFLKFLFNPEVSNRYSNFDEALKKIEKGEKLSVPLNKNWCITSPLFLEYPILYSGPLDMEIGYIKDKAVYIPGSSSFIIEEILKIEKDIEVKLL